MEHQIEGAHRFTKVHDDEKRAYADGCYGQKFPRNTAILPKSFTLCR